MPFTTKTFFFLWYEDIILLFYILNPIDRIHVLCASIRSPQFSSPFSMILKIVTHHASLTFLVSGQAQQGFSFFFSSDFASIFVAELPIFIN
ncbi:hypothetical protein ALC56_12213 [Trachymyrmex septentrionalis]|uniref:Uncharacterized protein n=1 Tax=Trachymyrmex septentrionalis TaxID=34720 RepID=A0A195EZE5_9HYME|nr:hypothetical protein ALC56_12213 [Trachymyrmex septentrionalis]